MKRYTLLLYLNLTGHKEKWAEVPVVLQLLVSGGVFVHPQLTLICIARLLQAVYDGLNTRHFLLQMLARVTVVCHAGVEGNLWAMFLDQTPPGRTNKATQRGSH